MTAAPLLRTTALLALALGSLAVAAQTAAPNTRQQQRRAAPPPPRAEAPLPPAPGEQIAAAAMAHFGQYECEFDQQVSVDVNHKHDGYVDVKHGRNTWVMRPVLSHTGALRLEDVKGRMLMLQIANKSMLMDTQVGRRLVDNCVHENQRHVAQPKPEDSLGIDPTRTAAAAAAAAASATLAANPQPTVPTASR